MAKQKENFSILDMGMLFEGSLSFSGKAVINGTVKGILKGGTIVIGEQGRVEAETAALHLTVGGIFKGNAEVSGQLSVLSSGRCEGEVRCGDLVIEPGAVMNAKIIRRPPEETESPPSAEKTKAKKKKK